ncbi:hypothetical protein CW748_17510 [Alteromonadales bacterium alter-6D02]|nr:hypothetical protein CW748_17510 [Alteromonadales bacterium alter-6D02]
MHNNNIVFIGLATHKTFIQAAVLIDKRGAIHQPIQARDEMRGHTNELSVFDNKENGVNKNKRRSN